MMKKIVLATALAAGLSAAPVLAQSPNTLNQNPSNTQENSHPSPSGKIVPGQATYPPQQANNPYSNPQHPGENGLARSPMSGQGTGGGGDGAGGGAGGNGGSGGSSGR